MISAPSRLHHRHLRARFNAVHVYPIDISQYHLDKPTSSFGYRKAFFLLSFQRIRTLLFRNVQLFNSRLRFGITVPFNGARAIMFAPQRLLLSVSDRGSGHSMRYDIRIRPKNNSRLVMERQGVGIHC
jgi:hypothetical protein